MLAAVPATAILRDVVHYLYLRLAEVRPSPMAALAIVGYGSAATPLIRATGRPGELVDEETPADPGRLVAASTDDQ
jgi:hypothetical protein